MEDLNKEHVEDLNKSSVVRSVLERTKTEVKSADVCSIVVKQLTDREVNRRAELLAKAFDIYEQKSQELRRIKPDQQFYNEKGEPLPITWSKPKFEMHKKAKEALDKIDHAVDVAINQADYSQVEKIIKAEQNPQKQQGKEQNPQKQQDKEQSEE